VLKTAAAAVRLPHPSAAAALDHRRRGGQAGAVAVERWRDEEEEGAPRESLSGGVLLGRVQASRDRGDQQHGEA
jgi:hypothetical protein